MLSTAFSNASTQCNRPVWQLYGTLGCHLCDDAETLLKQAQAVIDMDYQKVDIADLDETQAMQWADKIPVLVTPIKTLYYPFSLMDIVALGDSSV